jgi:large subunit ribosomal protein L4
MAQEINILNSKFETSGTLSSPVDLSPEVINAAVVHQVVKATLASRRQGTACTKTKAEVSGGKKKPFKQKGTGNARQGSKVSPLMPGGGVVFGPRPRSYEQKVNKKVMAKAVQSVLADKFQAGKLIVVESLPNDGKTKTMFQALNGRGLLPALVVTENKDSLALRALANMAQAKGMAAAGFSVYEAVRFENLVIEQKALEAVLKRLV